jgi:transposase-like protein
MADNRRALDEAIAAEAAKPVHCEVCQLGYEVDRVGDPRTASPWTCDDCGGYVPSLHETTPSPESEGSETR